LQSLSSEPVDGARDQLLLDILAELVVKLELGFNVLVDVLIVLYRGCGGVEEVEERGCRDSFLDDPGLLGV